MKTEGTHPQPFFSKLCCFVEFAVGNITDDGIQSGEMIAHVAKHVLLHGFRQAHELTRVLSLAGATHCH